MKEAIATGATVDEAKEAAFAQLGVSITSDVEYEILELPQKKTLGIFGGTSAKVRAFIAEEEENHPPQPDKKPAKTGKPPKQAKTEKNNKPPKERKEPKPAKEALPEGDRNPCVERAVSFLSRVMDKMGLADIIIEPKPIEGGNELLLTGDGLGVIIGHRGETLDALQHLVSLAANRGESGYYRITINTGNYREKREKTMETLARRMAENALRTGRNQALEPMNPYERRLIHTTVQEIDGVYSWSVGEKNARRVIIGTVKGEGSAFRSREDNFHREDNFRGENRHHDDRRGHHSGRREKPAPYAPQAAPRDPKKDADAMPLYGKIEKPG